VAQACPIEPEVRIVRISAQSISFGTGSIFPELFPIQGLLSGAPVEPLEPDLFYLVVELG
jgi:hypothetical protein